MGDPATVIDQYRRYVQDGRLEISEVMASELSDLLLSKKGKTLDEHGHLVMALRDLANIQEMRTKWKESRAAASMLVKARKRYSKLLRSNGMREEAKQATSAAAVDEVQRGRVRAHEGAFRSAQSHWKRARRIQPQLIEAYWRPLDAHERLKSTLKGAGKYGLALSKVLTSVGPVNRVGEIFVLQPEKSESQPLESLLNDMGRWLQPELSLPAKASVALDTTKRELERQMASIEAGEQAANAKLQAAIDTLQPALDYHEYSRGGSSS
jgi:tetratricopeptide (TPR) repeat protein